MPACVRGAVFCDEKQIESPQTAWIVLNRREEGKGIDSRGIKSGTNGRRWAGYQTNEGTQRVALALE